MPGVRRSGPCRRSCGHLPGGRRNALPRRMVQSARHDTQRCPRTNKDMGTRRPGNSGVPASGAGRITRCWTSSTRRDRLRRSSDASERGRGGGENGRCPSSHEISVENRARNVPARHPQLRKGAVAQDAEPFGFPTRGDRAAQELRPDARLRGDRGREAANRLGGQRFSGLRPFRRSRGPCGGCPSG